MRVEFVHISIVWGSVGGGWKSQLYSKQHTVGIRTSAGYFCRWLIVIFSQAVLNAITNAVIIPVTWTHSVECDDNHFTTAVYGCSKISKQPKLFTSTTTSHVSESFKYTPLRMETIYRIRRVQGFLKHEWYLEGNFTMIFDNNMTVCSVVMMTGRKCP